MKRLFNAIIVLVIIFCSTAAKSQDTAQIIRDLNKILSFCNQPYVHFNTRTIMEATPVINKEDTSVIIGEFFKSGDDLYYTDQRQEMFIEDSLFIQIDNNRKTIWISKVDNDAINKMNLIPLGSKAKRNLFRKEFVIIKTTVHDSAARLDFVRRKSMETSLGMVSTIAIQYSLKKMLPEYVEMNVAMKKRVSEGTADQIRAAGGAQMIQSINQNKFIVRSQKVKAIFENIIMSKQATAQIPSWKSRIIYDPVKESFTGKGGYSEYEITKTF